MLLASFDRSMFLNNGWITVERFRYQELFTSWTTEVESERSYYFCVLSGLEFGYGLDFGLHPVVSDACTCSSILAP
jgi:hypothetical protein